VLSALGRRRRPGPGACAWGGDDYLTKPFAIVELVARIEALLPTPSRDPARRLLRGGTAGNRSHRAHSQARRAHDRAAAARVSAARIYDAAERTRCSPGPCCSRKYGITKFVPATKPGGCAYGALLRHKGGRPERNTDDFTMWRGFADLSPARPRVISFTHPIPGGEHIARRHGLAKWRGPVFAIC